MFLSESERYYLTCVPFNGSCTMLLGATLEKSVFQLLSQIADRCFSPLIGLLNTMKGER